MTATLTVACPKCGLVSHRPAGFLRVRRNFVCGRCNELVPLDAATVLNWREMTAAAQRPATALEEATP